MLKKIISLTLMFIILLSSNVTAKEVVHSKDMWCYASTDKQKTVYSNIININKKVKRIWFGVENYDNDFEAYIGTYKKGVWKWNNVSMINDEISYLDPGYNFTSDITKIRLKLVLSQDTEMSCRIYLISVKTTDNIEYPFKIFSHNDEKVKLYPNDIFIGKKKK